jgi:ATP-dependent RNA helicase RhlE
MATDRPEGSKGSFATFGLSKNILRAVSELQFRSPRPVQAKCIPAVLAGRDVLGLAQTGTGKTAAFALPIIELLSDCKGRKPRALVLAPTRELALQIHAEFERLARYTKVRAITVFGGVGAAPQIRALKSYPEVVVACPGRLLDLMRSGDAKLDGVDLLVLDEADHMFDMGFLPDIKAILGMLPERRQNLFFSATMPREIRKLADRILEKPHVVELASTAPVETIEHALYPVDSRRKAALLEHLLGGDDFRSAIVFLRTKHRARRLAQELDRAGHRAVALQGNMSQAQRQRAMEGFRKGLYDVLVATDIAARGIDVANVSHVINFDLPNTPEAYTHRIGRTGRAEKAGKACTFVTGEDFPAVKVIERHLGVEIPRVKLKDFGGGEELSVDLGRGGRRAGGGGRGPGRGPARGPGRGPGRPAKSGARGSGGARKTSGGWSGGGGGSTGGGTPKKGRTKNARRRARMGGGGGSGGSGGGRGAGGGSPGGRPSGRR